VGTEISEKAKDKTDNGESSKSDSETDEDMAKRFSLMEAVTTTKKVSSHFRGVPTKLESIQGQIENVCCGHYNSFAVVKL